MARIHAAKNEIIEPLTDGWQLAELPAGTALTPRELAGVSLGWVPAEVPGTVASALRALGSFELDGGRDLDASDWWFRTRFASESARQGEALVLRFSGLATLAEVWLNGTLVLSSDNMFLEHEVDVTTLVREPQNELVIRFGSLAAALSKPAPRPRWRTRLVERQQLRRFRTTLLGRIPSWTPKVAAVGPFRAVSLARRRGPWPLAATLRTRIEDGRALVVARLVCKQGDGVRGGRVSVGDQRFMLTVADDGLALTGEFAVENAELWWPHTHGAQALYPVHCSLDGERGAAELDLGVVGFRTVRANVDDDAFSISVNGVDVFCRGACWTTEDIVTLGGEAEPSATLTAARDAGMNMLRVGGTMLYENRAFYAACDRLGLLVWQDFMFANLDYPFEDAAFGDSVRREAGGFLSRTETSPCIAVLCGGSEVEQQVAMLGLPRELWKGRLFDETLRDLSVEARADAVYLSSTPTGGALPFEVDAGVSHYYGVGAYLRPLEDARRAEVRFTSECLGFANIPEPATLDALLDGRAPFHDPLWKARVPRDAGTGWDFDDVRDHYTKLLFDVDPGAIRYTDPERALALGRVTSGEVMLRTLVEWRRRRSTCRGALIWFLKDLWAGAGWGLLDANGLEKAAYYYVKRALQPMVLFLSDEGLNGLVLHGLNDTGLGRRVDLQLSFVRDGSTVVAEGTRRGLELPARGGFELNAATLFDRFVDATYAYRFGPPAHELAVATMSDATTGESLGRWFHLPVGADPARNPAELSAVAEELAPGAFVLRVSSPKFAQAVALSIPDFRADDAYFHLAPGEERRINLQPMKAGRRPQGQVRALNARAPVRIRVAPPREADSGRGDT